MCNKLLSTVLHHHLLIRRQGQRVSFQITIPRDAVRIVGIETGIRSNYCRSLMPWRRDFPGGLLTLQASGTCFSTHVKVKHRVALPADLGYRQSRAGFFTWKPFTVDVAYHSAHHEPERLDIPAPRMLYGTYTDEWGVALSRNMTYRLSIYLWVTVDDLYNTPLICTVPS